VAISLINIRTPRDVIIQFDSLGDLYGLDGTFSSTESNDKAAERQRYLATINDALRGQALEDFEGELSVPQEFQMLIEQVDCLIGPGLPYYRKSQQIAFFNGFDEKEDRVRETVLRDEDKAAAAGLDCDWEVAAGWQTGDGPDGRNFALFCRSEEQEKPWRWRYTVHWIESPLEPLHDNIASLLECMRILMSRI